MGNGIVKGMFLAKTQRRKVKTGTALQWLSFAPWRETVVIYCAGLFLANLLQRIFCAMSRLKHTHTAGLALGLVPGLVLVLA